MGCGQYPTVSLKTARARAADARKLLDEGIDPISDRASRENAKKAETILFRDCALNYIAAHEAGWKSVKHAKQWSATLAAHAYPVIGDKPPAAVTVEDILVILKPIWHDRHVTASRVRNRIELVLDYARALKLRSGENPAAWRGNLDALLSKQKPATRHFPALDFKKLPAFFVSLLDDDSMAAKPLRLIILCATRSNETLNATWSEIEEMCGSYPLNA